MVAAFDWWLLIVGLVVGAGLSWLVLAESRRRDDEIDDVELRSEALWLAATMTEQGDPVRVEAATRLLELHRAYLAAPPPDVPDPEAGEAAETGQASGGNDAPVEGDRPEP